MKMQNGFTLIELMVVVTIAAILLAVAVPAYTDHVIRSKLVEATAALSDGRIKMEQFFQDNRTYAGGTCPAATTNFNYVCDQLTATTYRITANGSTSQVIGFSFTIDQANTKTTAGPWGAGATCWITKKGTAC